MLFQSIFVKLVLINKYSELFSADIITKNGDQHFKIIWIVRYAFSIDFCKVSFDK